MLARVLCTDRGVLGVLSVPARHTVCTRWHFGGDGLSAWNFPERFGHGRRAVPRMPTRALEQELGAAVSGGVYRLPDGNSLSDGWHDKSVLKS